MQFSLVAVVDAFMLLIGAEGFSLVTNLKDKGTYSV